MALRESSVVQCRHERSCCCFYISNKQSHSHSTLAQEEQDWEGPVALPAALWLPLQPRPAAQGSCALSPFPALSLFPQQQLRDGSVASASFQRLWLG